MYLTVSLESLGYFSPKATFKAYIWLSITMLVYNFFYFKSEKEVDFTVYNERQLTGYFCVTIFRVHLYKIIIFYMCAFKSILKSMHLDNHNYHFMTTLNISS